MDGLLCGKVAIVTGGAAGIGKAICEVFTAHGASVVINGLPGDPVDAAVRNARKAHGHAVGHVGDVGTVEGANGCVMTALDTFGKLDVLVANAGLFPELEKVQDLPLERFEELLRTNIGGVYMPVRAAIPALQKTRGAIVAAGSEAALHGPVEGVSYGATKDWVSAFIRGVAVEQAEYGVRANVVAPGRIAADRPPRGGDASATAALMPLEAVPLGRRGTPEEAANIYLFLASDLASYVTGAVYTVDGGATANADVSPPRRRRRESAPSLHSAP